MHPSNSARRAATPLLPNEPRIVERERQAALTARYLLPASAALEACLLALRGGLDEMLRQAQPIKLGKPYPQGQCLEIAKAFLPALRTADEAALPAEAAAGLRALRAFERDGGIVRRVWGDLRGQYFQNAFQVGTLYVDLANDTVDPAKPKVEILPFDESGMRAIRDFAHFARIARVYWGHEVYPNHVLPALAPYCPLIHVAPDGVVSVRESSQYMLALASSRGFAHSEAALREATMPPALFARIRAALRDAGQTLPADAAQGRTHALRHCQAMRAGRRPPVSPRDLPRQVHELNLRLARPAPAGHLQQPIIREESMPTVRIDHRDYELDSLPPDARAQLANIQFVDQELARLQATTSALRTAREVYANALKAALPPA